MTKKGYSKKNKKTSQKNKPKKKVDTSQKKHIKKTEILFKLLRKTSRKIIKKTNILFKKISKIIIIIKKKIEKNKKIKPALKKVKNSKKLVGLLFLTSLIITTIIIFITKKSTKQSVPAFNLELTIPLKIKGKKKLSQEIMHGQKGHLVCARLNKQNNKDVKVKGLSQCQIDNFGIGTSTPDYHEGRLLEFMDIRGFVIKNNRYYAKFSDKVLIQIPKQALTEFTNPDGIKTIIIKGGMLELNDWNKTLFPQKGYIGALVNLPDNQDYSGFAMLMKINENQTEHDFRDILKSLRIKN